MFLFFLFSLNFLCLLLPFSLSRLYLPEIVVGILFNSSISSGVNNCSVSLFVYICFLVFVLLSDSSDLLETLFFFWVVYQIYLIHQKYKYMFFLLIFLNLLHIFVCFLVLMFLQNLIVRCIPRDKWCHVLVLALADENINDVPTI